MAKNKTVIIEQGRENIINPKAGTILKLGEHDGTVIDISFTNAQDGQRDLEIKITIEKDDETTDTIVRIKNFFSSDHTKNISSFKDIIIDNQSYTINGFIEGFVFDKADKKGVIKGTEFNDTIYGTDGNDKIYTNGGEDIVYLSKGNDSIYGGKDGDMYIIGNEIDTTKIYNTTSGDVLNFENADSIRYEKVDNDLDINGVIIKDWFKKNNGQYGKMLSEVWDSHHDQHFINENTRILQDYRPEDKGQKITGINNMNSEIQGSEYNDKITSSTNSDIIYGNGGNDVIYANAKGDNTTRVSYGSINESGDFGDDTIHLNMKSDGTNTGSLKVDMDMVGSAWSKDSNITFERKGNDVIAIIDKENGKKGSITFKDYLKTASTVYLTNKADGSESYTDLLAYIMQQKDKDILTIDKRGAKKGQTIKGTWLGEKLYGSNYNDKIYTGGAYNFNASYANSTDSVYAGKGNDSIYVGSGKSEIYFYEGDGRDTIYMTKDTGNVHLKTLNDADVAGNVEYTKKGNDLIINRNKWKSNKDADILTIKDYFKQTEEHFYQDDTKLKTLLNGSAGESIRNISASKMNKSATLQGTFLNDILTGSNKNDKIYTNGGNDQINAGKGNDTIYIDGGKDSKSYFDINLKKGDGVDTIYVKNPENIRWISLKMDATDGAVQVGYEQSTNGKDLILNYSYDQGETVDKVIVKDFFKLDSKLREKLFEVIGNGSTKRITDGLYLYGNQNKANKLVGGEHGFHVIGGNKNDTIVSNSKGNSTEITGGKGNDTIILNRDGEVNKSWTNKNTLIFNTGDGTDTIYTDGIQGKAKIDITISALADANKLYQTEDGDLIVGNIGGYSRWQDSYKNSADYSLGNNLQNDVEYGRTYDISNSKMIFKDLLNQTEKDIEFKYEGSSISNGKTIEELKDIAGLYLTKANSSAIDEDTNKKVDFFEGSEKDDYIIAGKKYDMIDAGDGDDIIVVEKGEHDIVGGEGNDALVVKNLGSLNWVNGVERLQYNGNLKDLYFVFNVNADGSPVAEEYQGMGIGNSSIYNQYKTFNIKNGIWFEDGSLEELIIADKNGLNSQKVDLKSTLAIIKKNVQDYLKSRGYSSTMDLAENARSKKDIDDLMKIYKQGISGNDTVSGSMNKCYLLQAGAGDDTYIVDGLKWANYDMTIDDLSGKNDTLILNNVNEGEAHIAAYIKLKTDKKGNVIRDKKGNIQYTVTNNDLSISADYTNSGRAELIIKNYFKNGKIENIKLADGTTYDVNARLQEIAQWLVDNGFTSMEEAVNFDEKAAMKFLNGENAILSNNRAEAIGSDESEYISVKNTKDDVFTVDLKNGDDNLYIDKTEKSAVVNMGTGNKTIESWAKDTTINCSNADSLYVEARRSYNDEKGSYNITGSNGNDKFITWYGDATINAGAGDDVLFVREDTGSGNILNSQLDGGEGNDRYIINSLRGTHTITDSEGNDELILKDMKKDKIHFAFNVKADGTFAEDSDKLYILNDETYAKWRNGEAFDNGLTINDFDSIEKIATGNYSYSSSSGREDITYNEIADLNQLKEAVAGWLVDNNYADVDEVLKSGSETDIAALVGIFNNVDWQSA